MTNRHSTHQQHCTRCNCLWSSRWKAWAACSTAGAYLPTLYLHKQMFNQQHNNTGKYTNKYESACSCWRKQIEWGEVRAGIEPTLNAFGYPHIFVLQQIIFCSNAAQFHVVPALPQKIENPLLKWHLKFHRMLSCTWSRKIQREICGIQDLGF